MSKIENILFNPLHEALQVIGGKWRLLIVYELRKEKRRFGELKRLIPLISEKILIKELKHLVSHGILNRKAYPEVPPRVEYSLTETGFEVLPAIEQIKKFGDLLINKD